MQEKPKLAEPISRAVILGGANGGLILCDIIPSYGGDVVYVTNAVEYDDDEMWSTPIRDFALTRGSLYVVCQVDQRRAWTIRNLGCAPPPAAVPYR